MLCSVSGRGVDLAKLVHMTVPVISYLAFVIFGTHNEVIEIHVFLL